MAAWFLPALKAILPHVGNIISVAVPVFTRKSAGATDQAQVVQQQIVELQAAAAQNAGNIKALAEQLQVTVGVLEQAVAGAETRLRHAFLLCVIATAVSAGTLTIALHLVFTR